MEEDVRSDLHALRKLYSILQTEGNVPQGHGYEDRLDEKSSLLLKKLLDRATEQAFQCHAKIIAGQPASSHQPSNPKEEPKSEAFASPEVLNPSQNGTCVEILSSGNGSSYRPITLAEEDEPQNQRKTAVAKPKKLEIVHTESRREIKECPICETSNPKHRNSEKEKKDEKLQMPIKYHFCNDHDRHHSHHHRLPIQCRPSKVGLDMELDSNVAKSPTPEDKRLNLSEEAAAAIRQIDSHVPAESGLCQMAVKAPEKPKLRRQMLSLQRSQVTELMTGHQQKKAEAKRTPSRLSGLGESDRIEFQSQNPILNGSGLPVQMMMMRKKRRRAEKMNLPDPRLRQIPKERKEQAATLRTCQITGIAASTPKELGHPSRDQTHSQSIKQAADGKDLLTQKGAMSKKGSLTGRCNKIGETMERLESQVRTDADMCLGKVPVASSQRLACGREGPNQKPTNDGKRNPPTEHQKKVNRKMDSLKKVVGPTTDKKFANETRDRAEKSLHSKIISNTKERDGNGTDGIQSLPKGGKLAESLPKACGKKEALTATVAPTLKKLSAQKTREMAHRKDPAVQRPNKQKTSNLSRRDRMLSWQEDTASEETYLPRQMVSRMNLPDRKKPSRRIMMNLDHKNPIKQERKVGPTADSLPLRTAANAALSRTTSCTSCSRSSVSRTSLSSSMPSRQTSSSQSQDDVPDRMPIHHSRLPRQMLTRHRARNSTSPSSRHESFRKRRTQLQDSEDEAPPPRRTLSQHAELGKPRRASLTVATQAEPKKTEKPGKLRRFKDKLAIIFHHHHHHHHHHNNGNNYDDEITSPDDRHRRSVWKFLGELLHHPTKGEGEKVVTKVYGERAAEATAKRAVRSVQPYHRHQHGHVREMLDWLVRHLWHSRKQERAGTTARKSNKQLHWWRRPKGHRRGLKLANPKKPRVALGSRVAHNKKR